jgi:hypothetical protein
MYTTREYQGRVNGIMGGPVLAVDGMMGPKTRDAIQEAMRIKGVRHAKDLFTRGVRGIVWHWTAGAHGIIDLERNHYNWLFDRMGNIYDGDHTVQEQVNYDWRNGIGASHTRKMNTGWIGLSVDAMAGAKESPFQWGSNPLTWEGIDAMLDWTMDLCKEYEIPVSPWTTLSHAEVQGNLGIRQKWKWDYKILPGLDRVQDPLVIGNIMRDRMIMR